MFCRLASSGGGRVHCKNCPTPISGIKRFSPKTRVGAVLKGVSCTYEYANTDSTVTSEHSLQEVRELSQKKKSLYVLCLACGRTFGSPSMVGCDWCGRAKPQRNKTTHLRLAVRSTARSSAPSRVPSFQTFTWRDFVSPDHPATIDSY